MKNLLKYLPVIIIVLFLGSCSDKSDDNTEFAAATEVQDAYRQAWLDNDTAKVMASLSDSIILFPPGKNIDNIKGKEAVRQYWFSATGDTTYPIKVYQITNQDMFGENEFIFFTGTSYLEFETLARDSVQRRDTSRSEFMSVYKKENGNWRIFRQMWSVK